LVAPRVGLQRHLDYRVAVRLPVCGEPITVALEQSRGGMERFDPDDGWNTPVGARPPASRRRPDLSHPDACRRLGIDVFHLRAGARVSFSFTTPGKYPGDRSGAVSIPGHSGRHVFLR